MMLGFKHISILALGGFLILTTPAGAGQLMHHHMRSEDNAATKTTAEQPAVRKQKYHSVMTLEECLAAFEETPNVLEFQKKYRHHHVRCMALRDAAERKAVEKEKAAAEDGEEHKEETAENTDKTPDNAEKQTTPPPQKFNKHWRRSQK